MTASKLIRDLSVIDENILLEAANQPAHFIRAARYRVVKMRERLRADTELQQFSAALDLKLRARQRHSEERVTEAWYKAKIAQHPKHQVLVESVQNAEESEELAKLILEAYRHRRDSIKIIAEAQMFEGSRATLNMERLQERQKARYQADALETRRQRAREE